MSFIGGLFSGEMGAGFRATQATNPQQAQELYRQQQERLQQQQAFTQALMAQTPGAIGAQQQTLQQLQAQAAGQGPSVAREQLAETTKQNVARTGAMLGSQRGASANIGLMGRQAAMAGAGLQQQAAGQAATLRAQEQALAQQNIGNLAGQQIGQVAGAQQIGLQGTQMAQQNILDAIAKQNAANAAIAQGNQQFQSGLVGGLMGAGSGLPMMAAEGGEVKFPQKLDVLEDEPKSETDVEPSLLKSSEDPNYKAGKKAGAGLAQTAMKLAPLLLLKDGGMVDAMLSPGEKYLNPNEAKEVAYGKKKVSEAGKMVPGQAKVKGDSLKNDIVPAKLEEGGIVIPRSVMQSNNPAEQARKFVAAIVAKQQMKRK